MLECKPPLPLDAALDAVDNLHDDAVGSRGFGDSRDGRVYVVQDSLRIAVKVALITGRPLLLGGPPGCGKSSFASYVARNLDVPYYEFVASDDSRSTDLLWTFDAVRRLGDAQLGRLADYGAEHDIDDLSDFARYVIPGPLWWCFDPDSARRRGLPSQLDGFPAPLDPAVTLGGAIRSAGGGAVLLIDEVDKADLSFSNGLLVPLGARQFDVAPLAARVVGPEGWSPLVIITSNNERELPPALLRRCIYLELEPPSYDELIAIAERHTPATDLDDAARSAISDLAQLVSDQDSQHEASAAEFLDLVRVVLATQDTDVGSEKWELIRRLTLEKSTNRSRRQRRW